MEKLSTAQKTQIIIAIIGLIGILGGALFANWDKIFASKPEQPVIQKNEEKPPTSTDNLGYIISVWYYPSRENDAKSVQSALEKNGYIVNTYPRGNINEGKVILKSYIFFKSNDYEEMVVMRDILSRTLGEDYSIHASGPDRADKTMRVVLVDKSS